MTHPTASRRWRPSHLPRSLPSGGRGAGARVRCLGKEAALAKVKPLSGQKGGRYKPGDRLLAFLDAL
jgi:hypothetical protein